MKYKHIVFYTLLVISTFLITLTIGSNIKRESIEAQRKQVSIEYNKPKSVELVEILTFDQLPKAEFTREELLDPFLDTIHLMNKEKLPFDEPRTEYGQQDGHLRPKWRDAYFTKKQKFKFNDDTYYVFRRYDDTKKLYPLVPQVCSDFLVDAVDRSLGNWYYPSLRRSQYVRGEFSIRQQAKDEGHDLRRLNELVTYVRKHPEYFEIVFEGDGFAVGDTNLLKRWLQSVVHVELGDMIIISGRVPWDRKQHSHSFIITKMEDGYISRISGNAGMAREWGLSRESQRTPLRTVRYVIRLKNDLLLKMR